MSKAVENTTRNGQRGKRPGNGRHHPRGSERRACEDRAAKSASDDKPIRMSWRNRRKRRAEMASQVLSGRSIEDVAHEYELTPMAVRWACKEFGVSLPDRRLGKV